MTSTYVPRVHEVAARSSIAEFRVNGRFPAFVGLAKNTGGFYVEDLGQPMTVDAALSAGSLDYTVAVSEEPVSFPVLTESGVHVLTHSKSHGVYGVEAGSGFPFPLGVVGKVFHPVQNREAFAFGQSLIDDYGANVVAAGKWGDPCGSKTYMAFKLPEDTLIEGREGTDVIEWYVHVINGHDGGTGLSARIAPIQLFCTNQMPAFRKADVTLRHTASIADRIDAARRVMGLSRQVVAAQAATSEQLLHTPMSDEEFVGFMDELWAAPAEGASTRTVNGFERRRDTLQGLWHRGANPVGRGTRYGALNAVTEFADWHQQVRGGDVGRFSRIAEGAGEAFKAQAAELLLAV